MNEKASVKKKCHNVISVMSSCDVISVHNSVLFFFYACLFIHTSDNENSTRYFEVFKAFTQFYKKLFQTHELPIEAKIYALDPAAVIRYKKSWLLLATS